MKKSELEANSQILKEQLDNIKEAKTKDDEENTQTISKLRQQLSEDFQGGPHQLHSQSLPLRP